MTAAREFLYVGSYTEPRADVPDARGEGLAVFRLDRDGPRLVRTSLLEFDNPAFLTPTPSARTLVGVTEVGGAGAAAWSCSLEDPARPRLLGSRPTGGGEPCYVGIDRTESCALVTLIDTGEVIAFPLGHDGRLGPEGSRLAHRGGGPDPKWQDGPHPHCVLADPTNRFAMVADRGADLLVLHRMDAEEASLEPEIAQVEFPAGSGPRHIALDPAGRRAYVCCELQPGVGTVELGSRAFSPPRPTLLGMAPVAGDEANVDLTLPADIQVHPNGRFVYVCTRGRDSVTCFEVSAAAPGLLPVGEVEVPGWPRSISMTADGAFMFIALQSSGQVAVLGVDQPTGMPALAATVEVASPTCVALVCRS